MKLILKYIKPYWWAALLAPLLMLLEVFMDLMLPTLMARIVDAGIIPSHMEVIVQTGLIMLSVTFIGLIGGLGCTVFSTFASTGLARDLRVSLYEKVLSFSHQNIDKMETGSIITRLTNDVVQVETIVRMGLRILVRAPLQIVGSLILSFIISPSLSIIFLFLIPVIVIILAIIIRKSYPLFARVQEKMDIVNNRLQESLAGIRLVKAFVRQDVEKNKFYSANNTLMSVNIRAARTLAFAHPLMMLFLNLSILAVLWFGGKLVWTEGIQIGKVIAFINYMMQLLMSLIMVSHLLFNISRAQASIARLDQLLQEKPQIDSVNEVPPAAEIKGRIEFRSVFFSYNDDKSDNILKDLSFTVNPGEKLAILGSTGAGKTTLASLIPRLYDISSGEILIDNVNIKNYPLKFLRDQIGMSPQKTILFSGTLKDNITYGNRPGEKGSYFRKCAETASIDSFINTLPETYDTDIKQRGVNLSGGQKQRISIARALYREPSILIFDDSTSSVDTKTERSIWNSLNRENSSTFILITQRISSAVYADKILLLEDGEIAGLGTHKELLKGNPLYREIYSTQGGDEGMLV